MSLSAADANDRAEQLITLTERLTERLSLELRAFEKRRPHEAAPSMAETATLANIYRRESAKVKADPSLLKGASQALITQLRKVTEVFDAVLARHNAMLTAARTLTEGLVRAIASEITRQRAPVSLYGANAKARAPDAGAVTLNRKA
jgi:hypothetical protein